MYKRLKELRKELGITQQELADQIGVGRSNIGKYESGAGKPSAAAISLICSKFNVSEEWLRDGVGEMFCPLNRDDEIEKAVRSLLDGESDSFKSRLIQILAGLSSSDWERLEKEASKLFQNRFPASELAASKEAKPIENDDDQPMTVEEAEAAYIKSRSKLAKKTERSALSTTAESSTLKNNSEQKHKIG